MLFVSIPMVVLLIYILSVFSTGNVVWIFALDSLIITILTLMISIYEFLKAHRILTKGDKQFPEDSDNK